MTIQNTSFGSITIDEKNYKYDVVVRMDSKIVKRQKNLSRKHHGTSHMLSEEEIRFVYEDGCEFMIVGTGQYGRVEISPAAAKFLENNKCTVLLQVTPKAIQIFNKEDSAKKIGLFHLTC